MLPPAVSARPPRVSVIMGTYNAERWLSQAIDSVLAQDFTDFEFLIHDDGSTDGTGAILNHYAVRDARVHLSSGPNQGLAASLNQMINTARGDLLARMDADDICRPGRFTQQVARMDADPNIAVLGGFARYIDEAGRRVRDMDHPTDHDAIDARNMAGHTAIFHPTVMMRRAAVRAVGGYDTRFRTAQDLDLWLRMAEKFQLANCPAIVLDYRFHASSVSANREAEVANNLLARQHAAARRGLPAPTPVSAWRPGPDRKSQRDIALQWAWQGWKNGYPETARYYFVKALRHDPLSRAAWRGVVFGLLLSKRNT